MQHKYHHKCCSLWLAYTFLLLLAAHIKNHHCWNCSFHMLNLNRFIWVCSLLYDNIHSFFLLWLYYHVWIHFSHSPYNVWCMYSKQKHTNRPLMLLLRLVLLFAHISCVERRWKRMRNNFHLEAQRQINPLFNILSAWLCHSLPEL